jgi:hypothetical protein
MTLFGDSQFAWVELANDLWLRVQDWQFTKKGMPPRQPVRHFLFTILFTKSHMPCVNDPGLSNVMMMMTWSCACCVGAYTKHQTKQAASSLPLPANGPRKIHI